MSEVGIGSVVADVLNYEYENGFAQDNAGTSLWKRGSGRCSYDECSEEISSLLERFGEPACDMEKLRADADSLCKKLSPSGLLSFSERIMGAGSGFISLDRRYGALLDTPGFSSYASCLDRLFRRISEEGLGKRFKPYDKQTAAGLDEQRAVDQMDIQIATDSFMYLFDSALLAMSGRLVRNGRAVGLHELMNEQCYRDALNDSVSNHVCSKIIHDRFEYVFSTRLDHGKDRVSLVEKNMRIQDDLEALIGARIEIGEKGKGGSGDGAPGKSTREAAGEKDGPGPLKVPRTRFRSTHSMSR